MDTGGLAADARLLGYDPPASVVLGASHRLKMLGIHASAMRAVCTGRARTGRRMTQVVNFEALRNWSNKGPVCISVSNNSAAKARISMFVERSLP
jgi:hypothetical protein